MDEKCEVDFVKSWHLVKENLHRFPRKDYVKLNVDFVEEIQKRGYDKKLRAGLALFSIIISRSKEHGLKRGQHHIRLNAIPSLKLYELEYHDEKTGYTTFKGDAIKMENPFENKHFFVLLDKLLKQPID